jgi:pyridoxine 4-dehydrogenase
MIIGSGQAPARATPAHVRLAWTLYRGPHPRHHQPAHLAGNIAVGALRLTEGELALLDKPSEADA